MKMESLPNLGLPSQRWTNCIFWIWEYAAALRISFLAETYFFYCKYVLFTAEMILNKLLILSADTDMLGLSPFDVLYYLSELPVAHVLASSSLFNYLKPNFCTTSKRYGSLKVKCLLFTRS